MFILRRINGNGVQLNKVMGDGYTHICRAQNPDYFRETFKAYFNKKHVSDEDPKSDDDTKRVYGFVAFNGGEIMPLWKNQKNYIMTDSGKTFANLSFK